MFLIFETCEETSFAESIALKQFRVWQKLSHPMAKFRRHWRAAISQNIEAAQVIGLCFGKLSQQIYHRRHQHSVGHTFALDQLTETLRTELWNRDLAGTESRCCEHGGKIGNVKNWRRMKIDASFSVSHPIIEMVYVSENIGMGYHNALRPARCATGVDES